jgi:hypothetical protein
VNARALATLLHHLLRQEDIVRDVYQYPIDEIRAFEAVLQTFSNEDLLTRQDGLLVQISDGSQFRVTVVKTRDGR